MWEELSSKEEEETSSVFLPLKLKYGNWIFVWRHKKTFQKKILVLKDDEKNVALNQSDADLGLGRREKKFWFPFQRVPFERARLLQKNIQGIFSYDENSGATEQKEPKIYVRKLYNKTKLTTLTNQSK